MHALGKNPELETEILLCQVLNKNRTYLFAHPEELISQQLFETYQNLLAQRAKGFLLPI